MFARAKIKLNETRLQRQQIGNGTCGLVVGSGAPERRAALSGFARQPPQVRGVCIFVGVALLLTWCVDHADREGIHGRFPFDELITEFPLAEVNAVGGDGSVVKPVLTF